MAQLLTIQRNGSEGVVEIAFSILWSIIITFQYNRFICKSMSKCSKCRNSAHAP